MAEPFTALVIYPTTADAQTRQADNLIRLVAEQVRSLAGFRGARVFLSEDGKNLVTLTEWKSDTMMNTSLHYDVALQVMDERGNSLATNKIKGNDNLGNLGLSPTAGISMSFAKKFDALFDDDKIVAALK